MSTHTTSTGAPDGHGSTEEQNVTETQLETSKPEMKPHGAKPHVDERVTSKNLNSSRKRNLTCGI